MSAPPDGAIEAVLLDAGGVLLHPDADRMLGLVRRYRATVADVEALDRARYAAINSPDVVDSITFHRAVARYSGVPADQIEEAAVAFDAAVDPSWWTRAIDGTADTLRTLAAGGVRLAIVSNANGLVARQLADAGICQEGDGPCVPVDAVVDSYLVGVEKPDPRIFHLALDLLGGVEPSRAIHVGDVVAVDVAGARAAGVRPIHLDPYGDCPYPPDDHEHLSALADLIPLLAR